MKQITTGALPSRKVKNALNKFKLEYLTLLDRHVRDGWSFWSFAGKLREIEPGCKVDSESLRVWCHHFPEVNEIREMYLKRVGKS